MPPAVRSVSSANSGSATSTTLTVPAPAGMVAGDLVVGFAAGGTAAVPSARPSGATAVRNLADTAFNLDVVRKSAAGGDTFVWTAAAARKWAGVLVCIQAGTWDTTTVFDVENGQVQGTTASTSYATPSVTVGVGDCLLLAVYANNVTGVAWTDLAADPVLLKAADTAATGTTPASCALFHSALNAVSLGARSRTGTGGSSVNGAAWIGAVRPGANPAAVGRWAKGLPPGQRYIRPAVHQPDAR